MTMPHNDEEFELFMRLFSTFEIKSYCEIGVRHGNRFFGTAMRMEKTARLVAVDLPFAKWGQKNSKENLIKTAGKLDEFGYKNVSVIFGDSHDPNVIAQVEKHAPYDCVFIDADHTYDAVSKDAENYWHMASKMIAFHDICTAKTGKHGAIEVWRLWEEIKQKRHSYVEINCHIDMGIGVVV